MSHSLDICFCLWCWQPTVVRSYHAAHFQIGGMLEKIIVICGLVVVSWVLLCQVNTISVPECLRSYDLSRVQAPSVVIQAVIKIRFRLLRHLISFDYVVHAFLTHR